MSYMQRSLDPVLRRDLGKKILLVSGPRQSGKTTLAQSLEEDQDYLNYDIPENREAILRQSWRKDAPLLILDELHKMPRWKLYLKGLYDRKLARPAIVVTGSARLDIAKRAADSLAGRHFSFRLHPLTLKELQQNEPRKISFERLLEVGGFPEPYMSKDADFPARWRRSHMELILRQDVIDLEQIREINQLSTLVQMLRSRVGSTVSFNSLAEDLQVDFSTVKRWIAILENLYVVFRVAPWSKNIARSLTKASKFYFYDNGQVLGNEGARFENLVATALLREVHWEQDTRGRELSLHLLRNRNEDEIDFCIVENQKVTHMIEAKWANDLPSRSFGIFGKPQTEPVKKIQLIGEDVPTRDHATGVRVTSARRWLRDIEL